MQYFFFLKNFKQTNFEAKKYYKNGFKKLQTKFFFKKIACNIKVYTKKCQGNKIAVSQLFQKFE